MASPLPTLFGRHHTKQLDLDQPDGCDHDQNVYHYRLVDGQMIFRAVRLGHGWESRPMSWTKLSCYKKREDEQMANGVPDARTDKAEILARAKELIAAGSTVSGAARTIGVPIGTLHGWVCKEKKQMAKAKEILASVDAGIKPMSVVEATPVAINDNPQRKTCAACGEIYSWGTGGSWVTEGNVKKWYCENCAVLRIPKPQVICTECAKPIEGTVFDNGNGPRCFICMMGHRDKPNEVYATAPIGVEVPQYEPTDNDFYPPDDDEPIPYVVTPSPLDAQIDIMLDALWAEKKAKLKAHLKPLLADSEAWEMVKCIVSRGMA
jgi:hypothetical protein